MLQRFLKLGVIALMAWVPLCAAAQTIYKCKSVNGGMVYQSFPCAGAIAAEKQWSGSYRQPTNEELWQRYHTDQRWAQRQQAEHARRNAYRYSYRQPTARANPNNYALACAASRSEYNRVQADFKLNRNINLLRRLEADIRQYCEVVRFHNCASDENQ